MPATIFADLADVTASVIFTDRDRVDDPQHLERKKLATAKIHGYWARVLD